MADVELRRDSFAETSTTTTTKKTKKVKKTKRRESTDHGSEVTITEIEQTTTGNAIDDQEGYVNWAQNQSIISVCFFCSFARSAHLEFPIRVYTEFSTTMSVSFSFIFCVSCCQCQHFVFLIVSCYMMHQRSFVPLRLWVSEYNYPFSTPLSSLWYLYFARAPE